MFRKQFSSLTSTYIFMISFGLLMGIVFPFYSALFFGSRAFNTFYILGCLTAGLLVGLFSYFCIKQSLKFYLERQLTMMTEIVGRDEDDNILRPGENELQVMMNVHERLLDRVKRMVDSLAVTTDRITPLYLKLQHDARTMTATNSQQVEKSRGALQAVAGMRDSFHLLQAGIEQIADRSNQQVAISSQMGATIDRVAENMSQYAESVLATSAAIEEMVRSIRETGQNIEELACSTEQTASSIHQISTAISQVRDHAQRTATCAADVQQQASEGQQAMAGTLQAMRQIEQSSETSSASISRLSIHTEQVGKILIVIRDVVEQTNLLSLNASIIAAQAGEQGSAFAVVAEEVRSLARRTSQSAGQIEELVKNIQEETVSVSQAVALGNDQVKEGVKVANLTNIALAKIGESTAEVLEMVRRIVSATVEQASGSKLISDEAEKNLDRVKQVTRAVQEEKRTAGQIVATLLRMRELSEQVSTAMQEQAKGNHLYQQGVVEDNERITRLHETAVTEETSAGKMVAFVQDTEVLVEANATQASAIAQEIEAVAKLTSRLEAEIAAFRHQG
ncbi:MAG TPA: methyl-accepting chemotaxis protein [Geobacteraceae bacterium]